MRTNHGGIGQFAPYVLAFLAGFLAVFVMTGTAEAKTPGKTYCFRGYCHRVLTLDETQSLVGTETVLQTSSYDDCKHDRFNPCGLTSSGSVFRADLADNAASPIYPDGTIILVRNPRSNKAAVIRVNSAGPYHKKRMLDVSRATAEVLDFKREGVANLQVLILHAPSKAESTYRKNRVYDPVPGYLGIFASLDQAGTAYAAANSIAPAATTVAAVYPQGRSETGVRPAAPITGNGIERTWLAKAVTFKAPAREARALKRTAFKMGLRQEKLEATPRRRRIANLG